MPRSFTWRVPFDTDSSNSENICHTFLEICLQVANTACYCPTYAFQQAFELDEIVPNFATDISYISIVTACWRSRYAVLSRSYSYMFNETRLEHPLPSNSEKVLTTCILQNHLGSSLWQCERHCFDRPGIQRGIWNLDNSALVLPHFQTMAHTETGRKICGCFHVKQSPCHNTAIATTLYISTVCNSAKQQLGWILGECECSRMSL